MLTYPVYASKLQGVSNRATIKFWLPWLKVSRKMLNRVLANRFFLSFRENPNIYFAKSQQSHERNRIEPTYNILLLVIPLLPRQKHLAIVFLREVWSEQANFVPFWRILCCFYILLWLNLGSQIQTFCLKITRLHSLRRYNLAGSQKIALGSFAEVAWK